MTFKRSLLIFLSLLTNASLTRATNLKLINHSGVPIDLFWVNTAEDGHALVRQLAMPLRNSTNQQLTSFEGHQFVVRISKGDGQTHARFTKGDGEEVVEVGRTADGGLKLEQKSKFSDMIEKTKPCAGMLGEDFMSCIKHGITRDLTQIHDSISTVKYYRDWMALKLRDYACADDNLNSSAAIRTTTFMHDNKEYKIDVLLELEKAKIWTVSNFISDDECNILMEHGRPSLSSAAVSGDDGVALISTSRMAQQASYTAPTTGEDVLLPLKMRVLALTNSFAGYELDLPGQEALQIIQYNKNDHYAPHCDGSCDGELHNVGGRVASAIMYCQIAEKGGGTTFSKADIFVKPEKGLATFFSYKGSDGTMDESYTEHSGCPILQGEKWISTLWMREGVTAERTWINYDPLGVHSDYYQYDMKPNGEIA